MRRPAHRIVSAPYPGTVSQQGKYLVTDVPLPPDISTNAGGLGLYASTDQAGLGLEELTTTFHGKKIGFQSSVGCVGNKRPWKMQFTAQNFATCTGTKG